MHCPAVAAHLSILLQVPLISVGQPVNESVNAFAISSWAEIAYHDPSLTQYQFKIAEDLIYNIGNDTFSGRAAGIASCIAIGVSASCLEGWAVQGRCTQLESDA